MPLCSDCGKFLRSSSSYKYHIDHAVCKRGRSEPQCPYCHKSFSTTQMCQYHVDHSVCQKPEPEPEPETKKKLSLKVKTSPISQMSREELEHEVAQLRGENTALKEHPQTVNNTNNNNIIIFPTSFGKENMEYIKEKLGDVIKPILIEHTFQSIPQLIDTIHKNDKLPEYHNVYVANDRSQFAMVSNGKSFEYRPKQTIIDQIIEDKRTILNNYVGKNGQKLGRRVLSTYERYQEKLDEKDSPLLEQLELETAAMLLNMKSVIANDEKTRKLLAKVDRGQFQIGEETESVS